MIKIPIRVFDKRWRDLDTANHRYIRYGIAVSRGEILECGGEGGKPGPCPDGGKSTKPTKGKKPAKSPEPAPQAKVDADTLAAVTAHAKERRFDMPLGDLHAKLLADNPNMTPDQFRNTLVDLHRQGTIRLSQWSGPMDNLPHPELAIELHNGQWLPLQPNNRRRDPINTVYYYARPGQQ